MPRRGENITKRKDGRWEARIIRGYNKDGKALYKFLYGHSYAEVKAKKEEALSASKAERVVIKSTLTYDTVLTAFLLNRKNAVKESTYAHYCDIVDTHIRPHLGSLKMKQLSGAVIDRFTNDMLSHGRIDGKGGLAAKSVKDMLSVIRLSFKYAVKEKILPPEAIAFSSPKVENKDIQVFSLPEQKKLESIAVASEDPNRFGVYLCLYTGLRLGELCALRWSDVDFDTSMLKISRTMTRVKNMDTKLNTKTKIIISSPKTKTSERLIPLPSALIKELQIHKSTVCDDGYILTGTSNYIEPRNYYQKYKHWLSECGLAKYNFHALRHTFATRCIERGFDPKSLSEILGHADVNITLNRYVHPSMESKRRQMEALVSM